MISEKFEEQVFFTTTRITIQTDFEKDVSVGTGFLFNVQLDDIEGKYVTLLISNKHVFSNPFERITFNFNRKNSEGFPDFGNVFNFTKKDFSDIYFEHPDKEVDLACINATIITFPEHNIYYRNIAPNMLSDFTEDLLVPGLDVWFVGYPENRFDSSNNLPLMRRGYIASHPKVDFNSKKILVIDAQVFPGSSGSPVFAPIGGNYKLIGVVSATMIKHGQLQTIPTLQSNIGVQQILGLGLVIKATAIRELIEFAVSKIKENIKI